MERPEAPGVLLDHTQDKVVTVDDEGTFTYVNDAAKRLLGFEADSLVGRSAFEFVHPDDRERVESTFDAVIEESADEGTDASIEYRYRTADGSWVWLESKISSLADSAMDGYVVSSRDVSDRIRAEQRQQTTESRLEELAAKSSDVLWMFSADWSELLFVNPAYEEVYGRPVEEVNEDPSAFLDCVHPDDLPAVGEAMQALSNGTQVNFEYRVNPEWDYRRWVWVQAEPIFEDGSVARIVGFTRDITARRRREQQLSVMDKLLRHNVRNYMNIILGEADRLKDEFGNEVSERTDEIRTTGEGLIATAEKQREIIDLLTGPMTVQTFDLVEPVSMAVERVAERYPRATVETDFPDATSVNGLRDLGDAVAELVENAVIHSEDDDPWVGVTCRTYDDTVEVEVSDDCPPIPEYEYRVLSGDHEMNDVYHSGGLGLWLVYWVVELSKGDISFETHEADGNVVTVTLGRANQ